LRSIKREGGKKKVFSLKAVGGWERWRLRSIEGTRQLAKVFISCGVGKEREREHHVGGGEMYTSEEGWEKRWREDLEKICAGLRVTN